MSFKPAPSPQDSGIPFSHHCQVRAEKQLHEEKRLESSRAQGQVASLQRPSGLEPSAPSPTFSSHPQCICHSRWGSERSQRGRRHCQGWGWHCGHQENLSPAEHAFSRTTQSRRNGPWEARLQVSPGRGAGPSWNKEEAGLGAPLSPDLSAPRCQVHTSTSIGISGH